MLCQWSHATVWRTPWRCVCMDVCMYVYLYRNMCTSFFLLLKQDTRRRKKEMRNTRPMRIRCLKRMKQIIKLSHRLWVLFRTVTWPFKSFASTFHQSQRLKNDTHCSDGTPLLLINCWRTARFPCSHAPLRFAFWRGILRYDIYIVQGKKMSIIVILSIVASPSAASYSGGLVNSP